jgi:hypothetical protein
MRSDGVTPCGKAALKGMEVCYTHGGASNQAQKTARQRLQEAADPAAVELIELALRSPDPKVRRAACIGILDRSGFGPSSTTKVGFDDPHSPGEELAKLCGVPAWQIDGYIAHDAADLAQRIRPDILAAAAAIGAQLAGSTATPTMAPPAAPTAPYAAPIPPPVPLTAPMAPVAVAAPVAVPGAESGADLLDLADLDLDGEDAEEEEGLG